MAPSALDKIFQSAAVPQKQSKDQISSGEDGEIKELPGGYKRLPNGVILDKDGKPYENTDYDMTLTDTM